MLPLIGGRVRRVGLEQHGSAIRRVVRLVQASRKVVTHALADESDRWPVYHESVQKWCKLDTAFWSEQARFVHKLGRGFDVELRVKGRLLGRIHANLS